MGFHTGGGRAQCLPYIISWDSHDRQKDMLFFAPLQQLKKPKRRLLVACDTIRIQTRARGPKAPELLASVFQILLLLFLLSTVIWLFESIRLAVCIESSY